MTTIKGISRISIGGKNIPGGFMAISHETIIPKTEGFKPSSLPWIIEDTIQISRKELKRLLRKFPKQKKARLPRKQKKEYRKRYVDNLPVPMRKSSLATYLKMLYRIKTGSYNLQRIPYGRRVQNFPRKAIFMKTTNETELYNPGPIKVEGIDALYTIKPNGDSL
jgi:hypothetical protein